MRVLRAVEHYYEHVKFLAQNRHVDVVVCVIPENLYQRIAGEGPPVEETLGAEVEIYEELNFRRALKARTMPFAKPLQLVRQVSLDETKVAGQQDDATKAWNFCTALYYKSGPTIPWKLDKDNARASSCAVGISFYRSRDRLTLSTSLAQLQQCDLKIFNRTTAYIGGAECMHYIFGISRGQTVCSRQVGGRAMPAAWKTRPTCPETGVRVVMRLPSFSMVAF